MYKSNLERILTLAALSQTEEPTVREVMSTFSIDMDTLFSDLSVLSCCGAEFAGEGYFLATVEEDKVIVDASVNPVHIPLRLSSDEMLSFLLACQMILSQENHPLAERIKRLLEKVRASLKDEDKKRFLALERLAVLEEPVVTYGKVLEQLREAAAQKIVVRISYYSASRGEMTRRTVHPYAVFYHGGWWYMPAYDEKEKDMRLFRIDRVENVKTLNETFQIPDNFSLDAYQRDVLYFFTGKEKGVRIKFSKAAAPYVLEDWASRAKLKKQGDGSVHAKIKCGNLNWLVSELLPYGADAEILSPPDARLAMRAAVEKILSKLK